MKQVALLVYDDFSIREVADLMYMFRWFYDIKTVTFSSSHKIVTSEEGMQIHPEKTFDEFNKADYHCLIIPGGAELEYAFSDQKLFAFLRGFRGDPSFIIGAICAGPLFLSMTGLLEGKRFTNSMSDYFNRRFSGVEYAHVVYAPVVRDGNIITASGNTPRRFAIAIARACGFACQDEALMDVRDDWKAEDFMHIEAPEEEESFEKEIVPWFEQVYQNILEMEKSSHS